MSDRVRVQDYYESYADSQKQSKGSPTPAPATQTYPKPASLDEASRQVAECSGRGGTYVSPRWGNPMCIMLAPK